MKRDYELWPFPVISQQQKHQFALSLLSYRWRWSKGIYCISISSSTIPIIAAEGEVIDRLQKKKKKSLSNPLIIMIT